MSVGEGARPAGRRSLRRLLPLLLLLAAAAIVFATGLHELVSLATLRRHRAALLLLVAEHPVAAAGLFVAVYKLTDLLARGAPASEMFRFVALSIPGAVVLTLCGGFLFGPWLGTGLVVLGATGGAVLLFLVARSALGEPLRARAGPWLSRLAEGFRADAFNYLLALRLVPVFPFWLVNLVPALLGVRLSTFALATAIGIVPGSLVYASLGAGLGVVLERGEEPDLGLLLEPALLLPLFGLAVLALVPVLWRRLRRLRRPA